MVVYSNKKSLKNGQCQISQKTYYITTYILYPFVCIVGLYFGSANCDCDSTADCPADHICVISGRLLADDKCIHVDDASYVQHASHVVNEPWKWVGIPGTPLNVGQAMETLAEGLVSLFGKRRKRSADAIKRSLLLKKILQLNR